MPDKGETDLIDRTQSGESEAFSPLVAKYHPRLYVHIHRRVRDPETAKDLTQETWLRAFRSISSFRGNSAFYSWVYRIAENVCTEPEKSTCALAGVSLCVLCISEIFGFR